MYINNIIFADPPYGWALNAAALPPYPSSTASSSSASQTPSFAPLSLDTGSGNETAGSGFDHLAVHHDDNHDERDYLIPDQHEIIELRKGRNIKMILRTWSRHEYSFFRRFFHQVL